jgi:hypothetical protein
MVRIINKMRRKTNIFWFLFLIKLGVIIKFVYADEKKIGIQMLSALDLLINKFEDIIL